MYKMWEFRLGITMILLALCAGKCQCFFQHGPATEISVPDADSVEDAGSHNLFELKVHVIRTTVQDAGTSNFK